MTRDKLIEFLQSNYEPDETLVWQTLSFEDVSSAVPSATIKSWEKFVEQQDYYGEIADEVSELVVGKFLDWSEK